VNDPHVESLHYRVTIESDSVKLSPEARDQLDLNGFSCQLEGSQLVATPTDHFATETKARSALEPALEAWEFEAELRTRIRWRFRFKKATVVDRRPTPGKVEVGLASSVEVASSVDAVLTFGAYPNLTQTMFTVTPFAEVLRMKWRRVVENREGLLAGAYWCITAVDDHYGGRKEAARLLGISRAALDRIARLCAIDDPELGRKVGGPKALLSSGEESWLRNAIPRMILRVAEVESGSPVSTQLSNPDLGADVRIT